MHFGRWKKLDSIILKGIIPDLIHNQGQHRQVKSIQRQQGIMTNTSANKDYGNYKP